MADLDTIALEAARTISTLSSHDYSQYLAKIQVAVIAAINKSNQREAIPTTRRLLFTGLGPAECIGGAPGLSITREFVLRAMAMNYTSGHSWDHLDTAACIASAEEIKALRAVIDGTPPAQLWIPVDESTPQRNTPAIYWHTTATHESQGWPAIADEWRDEHHLRFASHWMPYAPPGSRP